jgi:hypothetical protein
LNGFNPYAILLFGRPAKLLFIGKSLIVLRRVQTTLLLGISTFRVIRKLFKLHDSCVSVSVGVVFGVRVGLRVLVGSGVLVGVGVFVGVDVGVNVGGGFGVFEGRGVNVRVGGTKSGPRVFVGTLVPASVEINTMVVDSGTSSIPKA